MLYACKGAGVLSLSPSIFLSLSLTGEEVCAGMLYACKAVHTLFTGQREREREGEKKRDVEYVQNSYFYF